MTEDKKYGCNHTKSHAGCGCGHKHNEKTEGNNQWVTASKASCACEHDEH